MEEFNKTIRNIEEKLFTIACSAEWKECEGKRGIVYQIRKILLKEPIV